MKGNWNQVDVVGRRIDFKIVNENYDSSHLVIISKVGAKIIRPIVNNWKENIGKDIKLK